MQVELEGVRCRHACRHLSHCSPEKSHTPLRSVTTAINHVAGLEWWSGRRRVGWLWFLCARKYVAENIKKAKIVKTNFPSEWRQGVWLGNSTKSSEFITDTEEEGVRALAINKLNEDGRWEERTYQENEWHAAAATSREEGINTSQFRPLRQ